MLTAAVNDIILVYCLAPVAGGEKKNPDETLEVAEIAHIFQEGDFTLGGVRHVDKGAFYAAVGAVSRTLGVAPAPVPSA